MLQEVSALPLSVARTILTYTEIDWPRWLWMMITQHIGTGMPGWGQRFIIGTHISENISASILVAAASLHGRDPQPSLPMPMNAGRAGGGPPHD